MVARLGEIGLDLHAQRKLALVVDHDGEAVELTAYAG
jgi:hypothetical protein